jgi:hypothetical protein
MGHRDFASEEEVEAVLSKYTPAAVHESSLDVLSTFKRPSISVQAISS